MNQSDDDVQLGWDGEGAAAPPTDAAVAGAAPPAPAEPTMPQPAASAVPAPPQPLGVPAPVPDAAVPTAQVPAPSVPTPPVPAQAFPVPPTAPPPPAFTPPPTGPLPTVPAPPGAGIAQAGGTPPGGSNKGLWITLAVLCGVIVVGGVVIAVLLMRGSDTRVSETTQPVPPSTSTTSESSTTTTTATTLPPDTAPATAPPQTVPSVSALPSGLMCKDLAARGVGYADAVRYYKAQGYPDRMDADFNGIPCETVYSAATVQAYWGTVRSGSSLGLPSGLLCADLHNRGFDYGSAVEYWIADGFPDRMDADHNGIPCETVYSAVEVRGFWDTVS